MSFRRCPRFGLIDLLLALLGFRFLVKRCCRDQETKAEMKAKANEFKTKLKDAFAVWKDEEPAEEPAPAAGPSENQG